MNSLQKGKEFEERAAVFYANKEYKVLVRNFRKREGEIDLICLKDKCLVFSEVKGVPTFWDSSDLQKKITNTKILRIKNVAGQFIFENKDLIYDKIRFDVVFCKPDSIICYEGAF